MCIDGTMKKEDHCEFSTANLFFLKNKKKNGKLSLTVLFEKTERNIKNRKQ